MKTSADKINLIISTILKIGAYIGIGLMIIGLLLLIKNQGDLSINTKITPLFIAFQELIHFQPISLITVGLLVLIATPIIRVLAAALSFLLVGKDRKYFLISTGVLTILFVSILLATR